MYRIIKGDKVRVISGKNKSKEGIVLSVSNKTHTAIVEGLNIFKKHQKPTAQNENKGGILEKQLPLPLSKLALVVDKATNGISKVNYQNNKGKKIRIAKKTKTELTGSKK